MDIGASINTYLRSSINDVLQQGAIFISKLLFDPKEMPDFFKQVYMVFIGIGVMVMAAIIAFRLVVYMIDVSMDQTQATVWEIIVKSLKASFMIVAAPTPDLFPNRWLEGTVENYKILYKGMEEIAKKIGVEN